MQAEMSSVPLQPKAEHQTRTLFHSKPYPHEPRNVNLVQAAEQAAGSFNQKIAITLTKAVGTMACAYIFALLAVIGFPGLNFPGLNATPYVQWISQTFIQLVMLSVIMVGQGLLGRKQELQAEEQFNTTIKSYHDIEQILEHLSAQDAELLKQTHMLMHLLQASGIPLEQVAAIQGIGNPPATGLEKTS